MMAIFQIEDQPEPFRMVADNPHDVTMAWLASKENGEQVWLPRLIVVVENLTQKEKSIVSLTYKVLRRRDRERGRCGLPPYWESIAVEIEAEAR